MSELNPCCYAKCEIVLIGLALMYREACGMNHREYSYIAFVSVVSGAIRSIQHGDDFIGLDVGVVPGVYQTVLSTFD
jgi:hypothetical protein